MVETFGTEQGGATRTTIARAVEEVFDLRPGSFREGLKLHRPIYQKTAAYGHFGRDDHDFTWERVDKAAQLRDAAGLERTAPRRASAPRASAPRRPRRRTRAAGPRRAPRARVGRPR